MTRELPPTDKLPSPEPPPWRDIVTDFIARFAAGFQNIGRKGPSAQAPKVETYHVNDVPVRVVDEDPPFEVRQELRLVQPDGKVLQGQIIDIDQASPDERIITVKYGRHMSRHSEHDLRILRRRQTDIEEFLRNPWSQDNPSGYPPVMLKPYKDMTAIEKRTHVLNQQRAKVTLNETLPLDVPHRGEISIGGDIVLSRDQGGLWFLKQKRGEQRPKMLAAFQRRDSAAIDIKDRHIVIDFEPPVYYEFSGKSVIASRVLDDTNFQTWEKNLKPDTARLLTFDPSIMAHGVSILKGGLKNLLGIVLTQEVRAMGGRGRGFWGSLSNGQTEFCAGPHGPYYIISNSGNFKDFEFVLPNALAFRYFRKALEEMLEQNLLQSEEVQSVLMRTHTYEGFMESRTGGR